MMDRQRQLTISVEDVVPAVLECYILKTNVDKTVHTLISDAVKAQDMLEIWKRMGNNPCLRTMFHKILSQWACENWPTSSSTIGNLETTLRKSRYILAADQLLLKGDKETIIFEQVTNNFNQPIESFTGRVNERTFLRKMLEGSGSHRKLIVIHGIGGIGKTQLCLSFIQTLKQHYRGIFWLNAETVKTLKRSFMAITGMESVPVCKRTPRGEAKQTAVIVDELYNYFSSQNSLVIFDNCDDDSVIENFLPQSSICEGHLHILVTSRSKVLAWYRDVSVDVEYMELKEWNDAEAIEFAQKKLRGEKACDAEGLTKCLQNFPLALQQAVAFILKERESGEYSIANFLHDYRQKTSELLDSNFPRNRYKRTTYTTWEITFQAMKTQGSIGQAAIEIIRVIAFLQKDGISRNSLFKLRDRDEKTVTKAVDLLVSYSMLLSVRKKDDVELTVHKLVQDVMREKLSKIETQNVLRSALFLVNTPEFKQLEHVTSVWHYASRWFPLIDQFYSYSVYINEETPLHLLAGIGDDIGVKAIVDRRALTEWWWNIDKVVNAKDRFDRTPVWMAASCGAVDVVEFLIRRGARLDVSSCIMAFDAKHNSNTTRDFGRTPLHIAAAKGHLECVKVLSRANREIANFEDRVGRTPLQLAAVHGHSKIVEFLTKETKTSKTDNLLLHVLANLNSSASDKESELQMILEDPNVTQMDRHEIVNRKIGGWNLLQISLQTKRSIQHCEMLVANGAVIDSSGLGDLLRCAAGSGYLAGAKWIVEKGAHPTMKVSNDGWTPFHAACQNGHTPLVKYFLSLSSSDVNCADSNGGTLLHTAAFHGKLDVVQCLLKHGANANALNAWGLTPLISAALMGEFQVVIWMLSNGSKTMKVNMREVDVNGETLLGGLGASLIHFVAAYDRIDTAQRLFEQGLVEVSVGSLNPLHVAVFFNSHAMVEYLIEKGADITAKIQLDEQLIHALGQSLRNGTIVIENRPLKYVIQKILESKIGHIGKLLTYFFGLSPLSMSKLEGLCDLRVRTGLTTVQNELDLNLDDPGYLVQYIFGNKHISKYVDTVKKLVNSRKDSDDGVMWVDKSGVDLSQFFFAMK